MLHEPLGGAGGPANSYGADATEPVGVYLAGTLDEVGIGIDAQALVEQYLAVAALATADEKDEVMAGSKGGDVGHAVGYVATDGVETAEGGLGRYVLLDVLDDALKLVERLGGLGVEVDITGEVELLHVFKLLDNDCLAIGLSDESQHLGMAILAEDDNLAVVGLRVVEPFDFLL